jgi:phospholipase C
MPIEIDASTRALLARHVQDPDLRAVAEEIFGGARLALDRALAHDHDQNAYPLPAGRTLESVLFERLDRLDRGVRRRLVNEAVARMESTGTTRTRHYGAAAAMVVKGNKEPVAARLPQMEVPAHLAAAAGRARQKIVQKQAGLDAAARAHLEAAAGPAPLVPRTMRLSLTRLKCVDDTAEVGRDEMKIATVAHELGAQREVTHAPVDLGKFRKGDPRTYDPPVILHEFPIVPGASLDNVYPASLYLAESDLAGGLLKYVENDRALHNFELFTVAFGLTVATFTVWLDFLDARNDFKALSDAAAFQLTDFIIFVGCVAPALAVGLAIAIVYGVVATIIEGLLALFKDEVFPPRFVSQFALPNGNILASGRRTHEERISFERKHALYEADLRWEVLMGPGTPAVETPPGPPPTEAATQAQADANLKKIKHVVVLMLENRSFDHMLGFLELERGRKLKEGLTGGEFNELPGENGHPAERVPMFALPDTQLLYDPPHSVGRVRQQVANGTMSGFVAAYKEAFERQVEEDGPVEVPGFPFDPRAVMGYHPAAHVPAYEILATEFGLCDRWFSSFAGNTWVNRTISLTGQPARRENGALITDNDPPFNAVSFFRTLDDRDVKWKFYSQDMHTLRIVDSRYRVAPAHYANMDQFRRDAENGDLPAVSWVEPNFIDFGSALDWTQIEYRAHLTAANDDHPPVDVTHAQVMVATVFLQLLTSQSWNDTLLIVTYDEHGGFYDHVAPPRLPAGIAESPDFASFGCRVPALVVSPFVGRGLVSSRVFDHTSIIKTILKTFCASPQNGAIPSISKRVDAADHLGWLLNEAAPRLAQPAGKGAAAAAVDPRRRALRETLAARVGHNLARISVRRPLRMPPSDLQKQLADARRRLGLPSPRPELVNA